MSDTVNGRLRALRDDYAAAERELALAEQRSAELRRILLRMSGAIQVLEELAAADNGAPLAKAAG